MNRLIGIIALTIIELILLATHKGFADSREICAACKPSHGWCIKDVPRKCDCYSPYEGGSTRCSKEKNFCASSPCASNGRCQPQWGNYYCQCNPGDYGENCDKKLPLIPKVVRTPQVVFLYDIEAKNGEATIFFVIILSSKAESDDSKFGSGFMGTFDSGKGFTFKFPPQYFMEESVRDYALKWRSKLKLSDELYSRLQKIDVAQLFVFPFVHGERDERIKMTISTENSGVEHFHGEFEVSSFNGEDSCSPIVTIECPSKGGTVAHIKRSAKFDVKYSVLSTCDRTDRLWALYFLGDMDDDARSVHYPLDPDTVPTNNSVLTANRMGDYREITGKMIHVSASFQLGYGKYFGSMRVKWTSGNVTGETRAMCVFKVTAEPLVAFIKGGETENFGKDDQLMFDASGSSNPNEPDHKQLVFTWSCWNDEDPNDTTVCPGKNTSLSHDVVFRPTMTLMRNTQYKFQVNIDDPTPNVPSAHYTQTVQVLEIPHATRLVIRCELGCQNHQSYQHDVIYLRVSCSNQCDFNTTYIWTVEPVDVQPMFPPGESFAVRQGLLEKNSTYLFRVTGGSGGIASYTLTMTSPPTSSTTGATCTVKPESGIVGSTFDITCSDIKDPQVWALQSYLYQSNNRSDQEVLLDVKNMTPDTESMWSVTFLGVYLAQGDASDDYRTTLTLKAVNDKGYSTKVTHCLQVFPPRWVEERFHGDSPMKSVSEMIHEGEYSQAVQTTTMLAQALAHDLGDERQNHFKREMKRKFVEALARIPTSPFTRLLQKAMALRVVLVADGIPVDYETSHLVADIMVSVTEKLREESGRNSDSNLMHIDDFQGAIKCSLDCLTLSLVGTRDHPTLKSTNELRSKFINLMNDLDLASRTTLATIKDLADIISNLLRSRQMAKVVSSEGIELWIEHDSPTALAGKTMGATSGGNETAITISLELARALEDNGTRDISVQIAVMKFNPLWFKKESKEINTQIVGVVIREENRTTHNDRKKQNLLVTLPSPLDIYLNINQSMNTARGIIITNGTVHVNASLGRHQLESAIRVHKVLLDKGDVFVKFLPTMGSRIDVVITQDSRPNLNDFEEAMTVEEQKTVRSSDVAMKHDTWMYVGILPVKSELDRLFELGNGDLEVKYAFHVFKAKCAYWNLGKNRWDVEGCNVGNKTNADVLHCQCVHLSIFSGSFSVMPIEIELSMKVNVFFGIMSNNTSMVTFVVLLLLVYALGMIWARRKDRQDVVLRGVTVLEDNNPEYEYRYLVAVFTGCRPNAGTTSSVGIQLVGENGESTKHILSDKSREVLYTGSDSWFLLTTSEGLKELTGIRLWCNYSGSQPSWYCYKVVVTDMESAAESVFLIEKWLSGSTDEAIVSHYAEPADQSKHQSMKYKVNDLILKLSRDSHTLVGILWRHPLSNRTRCQRLSLAMFALMLTLLMKIMFLGIPDGKPTDNLDTVHFTFQFQDVVLGTKCAILTVPLTLLITLLFKWSNQTPEEGSCGCISHKKNTSSPCTPLPRCRPSIVWVLCETIILISALFILLYGISYSDTKHDRWIASTVVSIVFGIFCLEPIKILVIALLTFSRRGSIVEYHYNLTNPAKEHMTSTNELKVQKKLKMHKNRRSFPHQVIRLEDRDNFKRKITAMITDLCSFSLLIIMLHYIIWANNDSGSHLSTNNIQNMLGKGSDHNGPGYKSVRTMPTLIEYLNLTLIPALHNLKLHNHVMKENATADFHLHLLGVPRFRQVRVRPNTCQVEREFQHLFTECQGESSLWDDDQADYNLGWSKDYSIYVDLVDKGKSAWIYRNNEYTKSLNHQGEFANYPGGGYIIDLDRSLVNSTTTLQFLVDWGWFDVNTRAIFVEFTVYNMNRNLFSVVTLVAELSSFGAWHFTDNVHTMKLLLKGENETSTLAVVCCVCVVVLLLQTWAQLRQIREISGRYFFSSLWNYVDFAIILLWISSAKTWNVRQGYVTELIKGIHDNPDEYISFQLTAYWDRVFKYLVAFIVGLSTARIWKLLQFGTVFAQLQAALYAAAGSLAALLFRFTMTLAMFASIAHLLSSSSQYQFGDIGNSFETLFIIASQSGNQHFRTSTWNHNEIIGPVLFALFTLVCLIFGFGMSFVIINNYFKRKEMLRSKMSRAEHGTAAYIKDKTRSRCFKKSPLRLRGGADDPPAKVASDKPNNYHLNRNTFLFKPDRLEAMRIIAANSLRRSIDDTSNPPGELTQERTGDILRVTLQNMGGLETKEHENIKFYRGRDDGVNKFIKNERLLEMEATVNMLGRKDLIESDDSDEEAEKLMRENELKGLICNLERLSATLLKVPAPKIPPRISEPTPELPKEEIEPEVPTKYDSTVSITILLPEDPTKYDSFVSIPTPQPEVATEDGDTVPIQTLRKLSVIKESTNVRRVYDYCGLFLSDDDDVSRNSSSKSIGKDEAAEGTQKPRTSNISAASVTPSAAFGQGHLKSDGEKKQLTDEHRQPFPSCPGITCLVPKPQDHIATSTLKEAKTRDEYKIKPIQEQFLPKSTFQGGTGQPPMTPERPAASPVRETKPCNHKLDEDRGQPLVKLLWPPNVGQDVTCPVTPTTCETKTHRHNIKAEEKTQPHEKNRPSTALQGVTCPVTPPTCEAKTHRHNIKPEETTHPHEKNRPPTTLRQVTCPVTPPTSEAKTHRHNIKPEETTHPHEKNRPSTALQGVTSPTTPPTCEAKTHRHNMKAEKKTQPHEKNRPSTALQGVTSPTTPPMCETKTHRHNIKAEEKTQPHEKNRPTTALQGVTSPTTPPTFEAKTHGHNIKTGERTNSHKKNAPSTNVEDKKMLSSISHECKCDALLCKRYRKDDEKVQAINKQPKIPTVIQGRTGLSRSPPEDSATSKAHDARMKKNVREGKEETPLFDDDKQTKRTTIQYATDFLQPLPASDASSDEDRRHVKDNGGKRQESTAINATQKQATRHNLYDPRTPLTVIRAGTVLLPTPPDRNVTSAPDKDRPQRDHKKNEGRGHSTSVQPSPPIGTQRTTDSSPIRDVCNVSVEERRQTVVEQARQRTVHVSLPVTNQIQPSTVLGAAPFSTGASAPNEHHLKESLQGQFRQPATTPWEFDPIPADSTACSPGKATHHHKHSKIDGEGRHHLKEMIATQGTAGSIYITQEQVAPRSTRATNPDSISGQQRSRSPCPGQGNLEPGVQGQSAQKPKKPDRKDRNSH